MNNPLLSSSAAAASAISISTRFGIRRLTPSIHALGGIGAVAVPPLARRRIFETVDGTTRIYAMPFTTTSTMWQLSFPYGEDAARALVQIARVTC